MTLRTVTVRPLVAVIAALALVPALAACSFEIVDDRAVPTPGSSHDSESGAGEPPAGLDRGAFDSLVSKTIGCASGSVVVDAAGGVIRVDGDCAELVVSAAGSVVIAGAVEELTVDGTGSTVFVDGVLRVELSGSGNTVVWGGETPEVSDTGVANTTMRSSQ